MDATPPIEDSSHRQVQELISAAEVALDVLGQVEVAEINAGNGHLKDVQQMSDAFEQLMGALRKFR